MTPKIGIIGGLSPESTVTYYLYLTRKYAQIHGGSSAPEIIIYSVNLEDFHRLRNQGRWDLIADELARAANHLAACGVEVAVIATNTMHKVFADVQARTPVKLISIIDAAIEEVRRKDLKRVALLGTRFTMTDDFFTKELQRNRIECLVPTPDEIVNIHWIIEDELVKGQFFENSRATYRQVIQRLVDQGAEGIILGCTEIPLLIGPSDTTVPVFDTATIHAEALLQHVLRAESAVKESLPQPSV